MKVPMSLAAVLAVALTSPAFAGPDGTLGPTSNGTFTVSATIAPATTDNVRVFGLDDFSFSGTAGGTISTQEKMFCVIRTPSGGGVNLTITGFDAPPAGDPFLVTTPGGVNEMQVLIALYDASQALYFPLQQGTPHTMNASSACTEDAGDPATSLLAVTLLNTDSAPAGNYSNSFLVTVAPQ